MEPDGYMKRPIHLLEISPSGSLSLNPEAMKILSAITQSVQVVTILGPPNTGKSYLMNRLANQRKGFPVGPGNKAPGRRMWMWCLPHPHQDDQRLVILDVDGLETKEQGDDSTETRICALALILSSIFLYNSKGRVDQEALDKLRFITKISQYVQMPSDASEKGEFPEFLWCVRDSELNLWIGGFRLTADDSDLLSILTLRQDTDDCSVSCCLRKLFHRQKCFEFCHPCPDADGKRIDEVLEGELDREFQMQAERLRGYVHNSKVKSIVGGHKVNGQMLARLIETCVSCMCNGRMIILENLCDIVLCRKPIVQLDQVTAGKGVKERLGSLKEPKRAKVERIVPLMNPSAGRAVYNMEEPVCLIENSASGELQVSQEALNILLEISQPAVVVAIVGLYRTGKSYLMNKLAGRQRGFSLGSTIQSHTKGIWMMCVPHPRNPNHCLILLDTEGLGDVEKGDEKNDSWIFALAVLLSSMLVYNSMGTIDQYAVAKLHYVTELTELIKVKSGAGDDESMEFARFFPAFVWSVRDFSLELQLEGRKVTADEYLDNALKLKQGTSKKIQDHNLPRECIRNYFPTRKCFVFDRPAKKELMKNMDQIADSRLDPAFVKQAQEFLEYVYSTAQIKRLKGGHRVTGRLLGNLALTYVDSIRSGKVPCLESTVHMLAEIENTAAVNEATKAYEGWMKEQVSLPTRTVEELSAIHNQCQSRALQLFMKQCFKDEGQKYQQEFMSSVATIYTNMCEENRKESVNISSAIILRLGAAIKEKMQTGSYAKSGGYAEYVKDVAVLVEGYRAKTGKGVQAEQVLQDFLEKKQQFSEHLRLVDKNMMAREKQLAAERERAEIAEQERKWREEEKRAAEQLRKDEKQAMEDTMAQLKEKLEQERSSLQQEHEKVLNQRLLEQKKLNEEGFQGRAREMKQEIDSLKKQQKDLESPSYVDIVLDVATLALPGYYRLIPAGLKLGKNLWKKFF
ncbi:guanylate-binding protein 1-like isoform X1 [Carcharodon carcharias]|uniref:guanylate-binding protein 1-like isoform X1 n=2 Tax=Carcharodon carcharias TaxID=13397 RepID=UPI001B7F2CC3|nr:guanylate-binding protein 1-like isoform X1 [Carcharodon carcharias]XP_041032740.1 guanylate-binding protein 1-like isoform X1 [Carcharodon carcharias]XP_041032741.1 guanylate-binding protein 1-like isoform X1 [Carcharodon carcharias]XP_041032742.1 guanylate-binding protein 1-like isoform X1 [Carcharodon carcharias]XP_041032743.1 guanylate-binding protein 1-like isoform X1 [Carcharodon carcharias]